jgi:hypothetical protein
LNVERLKLAEKLRAEKRGTTNGTKDTNGDWENEGGNVELSTLRD